VLETVIEKNFVMSNYASTWPLDHDDGSCFYHDRSNYLIYAGAKNYKGFAKKTTGNVYVHADANGAEACRVDDSLDAFDVFANNKCITSNAGIMSNKVCDPHPAKLNATVDVTSNNSYFTPDGAAVVLCPLHGGPGAQNFTFVEWQKLKQEAGSTVSKLPDVAATIRWGREVLGM
jgi:hypothetical protein